MPKLRFDQYLCLVLISIGLLFSHRGSALAVLPQLALPPKVSLIPAAPVPVFDQNTSAPSASSSSTVLERAQTQFAASLSAQAIYVLDVPSTAVLFDKNADQLRYPASTTKLLSALVAREIYSLDTFFTVRNEGLTDGTILGLRAGERLPVRNLLSAMLIQSANDAAEVIANNHPQGRAGFIQAMNDKARALHLDQSHFTNPSGIDTQDHHSSAHDLALLTREVMKDQLLSEIIGTKSETIKSDSTMSAHVLNNTHALLGTDLGVIGGKTGTTQQAGEVLITQLRRDSREILIVVMGSQDRYRDTKLLIEWIFTHYGWIEATSVGLD